jgi:integrase
MFCTYFEFLSLPASSTTLCLYVQFLSRSFSSVDSIRNYISGVKKMHILKDCDLSAFLNIELTLALKGLARIHWHTPKQALPITPEILMEFAGLLDLHNQLHLVYWCLFLLAFFLMARKSNLVPDQVSSFDPKKQLCRGDVFVHDDLLLVSLKWSKTIQCGERLLQVPLLPIPGSALCPYTAFTRMCDMVKAPSNSPAFVYKKNGGLHSITYSMLQSFLKRLVERTGRDPELYSSHSFRRGGASWAFRANVPSELIQIQGDWKSDAYKLYLHFDVEDRLKVARQMCTSIQQL